MLLRLFIAALWSPEGKGLTSWLLFVMFIVILLLSHFVSWDRCGTWLYRFLIPAVFLTYKMLFEPHILSFFPVIRLTNSIKHELQCKSLHVPQRYPISLLLGRVAQSVTCLAIDACLTADPGVASSIPARSHTSVEIDQEIISTFILLLPST